MFNDNESQNPIINNNQSNNLTIDTTNYPTNYQSNHLTTSDNEKIGSLTIWSIGVGAALGGSFFGWQFILYGGLVYAIIAVIIAAGFYWLYAATLTELSARYKTSGGSFDFVNRAMGPRFASLMAILSLLKLILGNAANGLSISSYLRQAGMPSKAEVPCWIVLYSVFTLLDCLGVKQSANAQISATMLCMVILLIYFGCSMYEFRWSNIISSLGVNSGFFGFFEGLVFGIAFFDGFEDVPLLVSYTKDPDRQIPQGLFRCYVTVASISGCMILLGVGSSGSNNLVISEAPLMYAFEKVFKGDDSFLSDFMAYLIVLGLIVNFFAFTLFISQQLQAVAEAGHLPSQLAYRQAGTQAPVVASIVASSFGLFICITYYWIFGESLAQNMFITASLLPAVLGYALVVQALITVRKYEDSKSSYIDPDESSSLIEDKNKPVVDVKYMNEKILGEDPPKALRFPYPMLLCRLSQMILLLYVISLITLGIYLSDYMWGLVSVVCVGIVSGGLMLTFMNQNESLKLLQNNYINIYHVDR